MKNVFLLLSIICLVIISNAYGAGITLSAPFADGGVNLQQGWYYHPDMGGGLHLGGGFDYVLGPINQSAQWKPFIVLSAHDGTAKYLTGTNGGLGNHVKVTITIAGVVYQTTYAHLQSSLLPVGVDVSVSRGGILGISGNTGNPDYKVHLHFVFKINGSSVDPYGVYKNRDYYPENGGSCGNTVYWTECPPIPLAPKLVSYRGNTPQNDRNPYGWFQS
ncbi:MAG: hypothetical protein ACD_58C00056G0001, partial [uncultured bacterium]